MYNVLSVFFLYIKVFLLQDTTHIYFWILFTLYPLMWNVYFPLRNTYILNNVDLGTLENISGHVEKMESNNWFYIMQYVT